MYISSLFGFSSGLTQHGSPAQQQALSVGFYSVVTTKSDKYQIMALRLTCFLLLFLTLKANGQTNKLSDTNFRFWVASLIDDTAHKVISYYLTSDSIIGKKGADWNFSKMDTILFALKLTKQQKSGITKITTTIKSRSFKSFYYNPCIIHGTSVEFSFRWTNLTKRTTLSNYYLEDVSPLVHFINKMIPFEYEIPFDKSKLQNDLKMCNGTN
ncbi:MAG: hypothetical protein ICV79_09150 [Flavisolibacter sp.]|nr:hypothetical protein [Flavisolibacter sp.]